MPTLRNTVILSFSLLLFSTASSAANYFVEDETLVCDTEKTYRSQIKHLVDGNRSVLPGCEITMGDTPVLLIDANLTGPSEVEIKLTGRRIWVANEALHSK